MKKLNILLVLVLCVNSVFAQSQRTVMAEEFTQASCGPCAAQNPAFNALLGNNTTKVISMKYQTSWPGVDPMNTQTQTWVGPRVTYYGVSGVPTATMDGTEMTGSSYAGAPANWTQTKIDTHYAISSPFDLSITHAYNATQDSIQVSCTITCTQATSGNLVLHVAMVEKTISFVTAPGTNGETTFYSVMRKMLPDANGTALSGSWTVGQTQTINFNTAVPSYIYDRNELAMVCFIQDNSTFTGTGTNTSGSTSVVLTASNPNIVAGTFITGTGVPAGTIVSSLSGAVLTLSGATTASSTGATFTFSNKKVQQAAHDEPLPLNLDASLKQASPIPPTYTCNTSVSPSFMLTNTGSNPLTAVDIAYTMTGLTGGVYSWTGNLAPAASTTVNMPALTANSGSSTYTATISTINGAADANTGNNSVSMVFNIPSATSLPAPITADFATATFPPTNWMIGNYGSAVTWIRSTAPSSPIQYRGSAKMPFHDGNAGEIDYLYLPAVDLSSATASQMTFSLSKAPFQSPYLDRLDVVVSTDCGQTWTTEWSKTDPALGTVPAMTTSYYTPSAVYSASQWRLETVNLTPYIGQPSVYIAFKAISGKGNNGYIDDVNLTTAVGIGENSKQENISMFPVPTSDFLYIDLSSVKAQTVNVSITDAAGRLLRNEIAMKANNLISVNLSSYQNGTYFVKVEADGKSITKTAILNK